MDHIEKLFRKIAQKDKITLIELLVELKDEKGRKKLRYTKLKKSDFYRLRKGQFRIIFHFSKNKMHVVVDSIRLRNEKTYKRF